MNILIGAPIFILGLCAGSFLNVVIYRLPRGESPVRPASHCPACGKRLTGPELVPLLSYIVLGGKCRHCRRRISLRYPLVELAAGVLFTAAACRFGLTPDTLSLWFLFSLLLAVSLIDLEHQRIPNPLVVAGLAGGLAFRLWGTMSSGTTSLFAGGWPDALWGLLLGGGIMLLIFLASRGGMGGGDVKLAALLGFWIGFRGIAITMILGFLTGALAGVVLILLGLRRRKDPLPFGPFLSLGTLIALFWGDALFRWYLKLIGW